MSWQTFENDNPELAAFGRDRLNGRVSYLATSRADGSPRVHPVTPIIGAGRMFIFMEPTSPKGRDLQRDDRFAMHCGVENNEGGQGEFFLSGRATLIEDPAVRSIAIEHASYQPADRYILFELSPDSALGTVYEDSGPQRRRWERKRVA